DRTDREPRSLVRRILRPETLAVGHVHPAGAGRQQKMVGQAQHGRTAGTPGEVVDVSTWREVSVVDDERAEQIERQGPSVEAQRFPPHEHERSRAHGGRIIPSESEAIVELNDVAGRTRERDAAQYRDPGGFALEAAGRVQKCRLNATIFLRGGVVLEFEV